MIRGHKAISFAWTTPALVAGHKTVTRRDWKPQHAQRFKAGELVVAWDKQPRFRGAKQVALIRITQAPYLEWSDEIPDEDWDREGFGYAMEHGLRFEGKKTAQDVWDFWKANRHQQWVVRFEVVEVLS